MSAPDANGSSSQPPTAEPLLSHQLSSFPPETPSKEEPVPVQTGLSAKQILVGNFDWIYLCMPLSGFLKSRTGQAHLRFRRDFEFIPLLLNIILGLQHACVALGYIVAVPLTLDAILGHFDRPPLQGGHLIGGLGQCHITHAAVIIAGIGSLLQCIEIKIPYTPYQIGTGTASLLGNSHIMLSIFLNRIMWLRYDDPELSVHDAYGKVLGTAAVCSLFLIALALVPRKYIKPAFPPVVTSVIVILVGLTVLTRSLKYWGGGTMCAENTSLPCTMNGNVHLRFGSSEYLGLGLFVMLLFFVFELFGTGLSRHISILLATLIVYAVSAIVKKDGSRYVTGDEIDKADDITFLWHHTYELGFDKYSVLPLLGGYLIIYFQATGILTATLHEAQLDITGADEDQRIQGGLIVTGVISLFAVLATGLPVVPVPQTNSVTYITRIASRFSGISAAIWLFILGVFPKVMAFVFSEIPVSVRGGIFTIVSATVILTGFKILCHLQWDRRTSVVMFFSLAIGLSNILVPEFINEELWPETEGDSDFHQSAREVIIMLLRTPFFMGGLSAMILHFGLPKDMELGFPDALPGQN